MAKKWFSIMAVMVVLSMLLTACGGSPTATVVPPTATTGAAATATTAKAAATATTAKAAATATTAKMAATATTGAGTSGQSITVTMNAQNGSGETGKAVLTPKGDADVTVSLSLTGAPADAQPAHIHKGTCATLDPTPLYPLTNVVNGKSDSEVMVTMAELEKGPYAINVHKSATEVSTYVSCGDISTAMMAPTATTAMAGTTPGATMDYSKVGPELAAAFQGQYKGTKVSMFGPFTTDDEVKFNNSMKSFEAATGIDIQYQGSKEFETTINVRVEGGSPPDIADFPQPGLMASIAKSGKVQDANKMINPAWLKQNYNQGYLDTATVDGPNGKILGGIFQRVNAKGLVFYPKKAFDAAGYKAPTTWAELQTLMDKIVKDGDTPWCIGIESGTATGWPATDWTEQMMLRTTSLDNYDKWVAGTLPFTDPIVKNAVQKWSDIWFNDQYVYGGRKQIVTTNFGDAPKPMFTDPPKCWLMDQGNFISSFFESIKPGVVGGVDYDFFQLPAMDPQYGAPVEFGGDLMTAFNDRPEVRAVLQYFSTFDGVRGWVSVGGALAPQKDSDLSAYSNAFDRKVAEVLVNASAVRFDGSDLMPGAVGAGTFWKGMTDYVSGSVDIDQALKEAQDGWAGVKK